MTVLHAAAIFAVGIAAGTVNTVVGSGTLLTFPTLLAFGYAPLVANVSNNIGLVPGTVSGAWGYRRLLAGQRARVLPLAVASTLGGIIGAVLLLSLPPSAFAAIVPVFIAVALLLIVAQRPISRWLATDRGAPRTGASASARLGVACSGVYGGYFGAAQGILLLAILGLTVDDELQRLNAAKVVLAGTVNCVAGVIFVFVAHVNWAVAGLIAAGSLLGGMFGARFGQRLSPTVLRWLIVIVGVVAIVKLL
ncbi:sulfite exporter TauE/SafE family protein [Conexibacter sp. DBS9H8]|uniref:sulfite exporter TauE/SafE family protein n=1 Tax=Conexibacter sp. DBS9H8 TaxID=2937801 RepID=UPI00200F6B06|nr:sulfite exporter TauE/SafE family protein [Conexibacter sp. DBS9H8]